VQLHVLAPDSLEHRGRAGVADIQREQDLPLAPEVLDCRREERVHVLARHRQPLLEPDADRPEQAARVRELMLVLLRQRHECRMASHGLPPSRRAHFGLGSFGLSHIPRH